MVSLIAVALLGCAAWLAVSAVTEGSAPAAAGPVIPPSPVPPPSSPGATAPALATPTVTSEEQQRCGPAVACVDLPAHQAWLQRDGRVVYGPVPILPGADTGLKPPGPASSATPIGQFRVLRKEANGVSTEFGEPMPNAVYFTRGGIAFHEGSLTETSNGCVHLSPEASKTFYDQLTLGDGVTVF